MAITIATELIQVEITEGRCVICYFFQIVRNNGIEIGRQGPHTISLAPNMDAQEWIGRLNDNITTRTDMLWAPIDSASAQRVIDYCNSTHTPEVVAAYEQWLAAQTPK